MCFKNLQQQTCSLKPYSETLIQNRNQHYKPMKSQITEMDVALSLMMATIPLLKKLPEQVFSC